MPPKLALLFNRNRNLTEWQGSFSVQHESFAISNTNSEPHTHASAVFASKVQSVAELESRPSGAGIVGDCCEAELSFRLSRAFAHSGW